MGLFGKSKSPEEKQEKLFADLKTYLLEGEEVQQQHQLGIDLAIVTAKRLLFVNKEMTKPDKQFTTVPWSKISGVSLAKGTISRKLIIHVGSKDFELGVIKTSMGMPLYHEISKRIL